MITEIVTSNGLHMFFWAGNDHYHCRLMVSSSGSDGRTAQTGAVDFVVPPQSDPLSLEEQLAVAILRKDELAALAAADDILERFNRPEGYKTRDELKMEMLSMWNELADAKRQIKELRQIVDRRDDKIEVLMEDLAEARSRWPGVSGSGMTW